MRFSALLAFLLLFNFGFAQHAATSHDGLPKTFEELIKSEQTKSQEEAAKVKSGEATFNPVPVIMHHIADAHDWHLWGEGENSVTIPLPVILWDNGLQVFMSSKFHHNEAVVESNGNYYINFHEKIYKTDAQGTITPHVDEKGAVHLQNAKALDFSITKNVASMLLSFVILILVFSAVASNYKKGNMVPKGIAGFIEPLIIFIRDEVAIPNIGEKK